MLLLKKRNVNNITIVHSCKSVKNVLNKVKMSEKKKKSGACNKRLRKETKPKEVANRR